jgi:hypothetical protein
MPPRTDLTVVVDTYELEHDLERIATGELGLPTVSGVALLVGDDYLEELPIYLE